MHRIQWQLAVISCSLIIFCGVAFTQSAQETRPDGEPCPSFCDYYFADTHFHSEVLFHEEDEAHWQIDEMRSTLTSGNQLINGVQDTWEVERFAIFSPATLNVFNDTSHDGHRHTEDYGQHVETSAPGPAGVIRKGDNTIIFFHEYILRDRLGKKPNEYYYPKRLVEDM